MTRPPAAPARQPLHRRRIDVQVFSRDDGLWDVEATLTDTRAREVRLGGGTRAPGEPIHDLMLRLVVDRRLDVVEAGSASTATPYPGHCDALGEAYAALIGLNLLQGFHKTVRERLGGSRACTHLTEMAQVLPTAVVQALAGEVFDTRGDGADARQPMHLDRCHALRLDGEVVRQHYPRWYRRPGAAAAAAGVAPGGPMPASITVPIPDSNDTEQGPTR